MAAPPSSWWTHWDHTKFEIHEMPPKGQPKPGHPYWPCRKCTRGYCWGACLFDGAYNTPPPHHRAQGLGQGVGWTWAKSHLCHYSALVCALCRSDCPSAASYRYIGSLHASCACTSTNLGSQWPETPARRGVEANSCVRSNWSFLRKSREPKTTTLQ